MNWQNSRQRNNIKQKKNTSVISFHLKKKKKKINKWQDIFDTKELGLKQLSAKMFLRHEMKAKKEIK